MDIKLLLKERKMKKKKFRRTDVNKYPKFSKSWRKPRGLHNKMRLGIKGHNKSPSTGYGSNKLIRGLTNRGIRSFVVNNVNDLERAEENFGIIIGANVGIKRRIQILNKIKEKKLEVLNIKNIDDYIKTINEYLVKKKEESKKRKQKKSERKEVKKETKEEKKDENRK